LISKESILYYSVVMKLFLDDCRIEPLGWVRVTTAENCIEMLRDNPDVFTEASLDHDLDDHIDTRQRGYCEQVPLTGYDVACWLEEQAHSENWRVVPKILKCHSANPVGRKRIEQTIASIEKMRTDFEEKLLIESSRSI